MRRRLPLFVPLIVLVPLGVAFARTMAHDRERLAGSNSVKLARPVVQISGGSRLCQPIVAPRESASALLFAGLTAPTGPPLTMTLTSGGRLLASSRMAGGWTGGLARFAFRTLERTYAHATICVRNDGAAPIAFSGVSSPVPTETTVDAVRQRARVTVELFRPGTSTWWSLLPAIAHRVGVLKGSLSGGWGFWLAAACALLAGAGSLALVLRGLRG